MATPDQQAAVPDPVPKIYEAHRALLSRRARELMDSHGVPYSIQCQIASDGYKSLEDLADRFDSAESARSLAPSVLKFSAGTNTWDEETSNKAAMKFYQCVRDAKRMIKESPEVGSYMPLPDTKRPHGDAVGSLVSVFDRPALEKSYEEFTRLPKRSLTKQTQKSTMLKQYSFCAAGQIGVIHSKFIIPYYPEDDEKPYRMPKSRAPGETEEEETRKPPFTRRGVERIFDMFHSKLPCSCASLHSCISLSSI